MAALPKPAGLPAALLTGGTARPSAPARSAAGWRSCPAQPVCILRVQFPFCAFWGIYLCRMNVPTARCHWSSNACLGKVSGLLLHAHVQSMRRMPCSLNRVRTT
eukprot:352470-Chlamydomonas_euryale.AAC.3